MLYIPSTCVTMGTNLKIQPALEQLAGAASIFRALQSMLREHLGAGGLAPGSDVLQGLPEHLRAWGGFADVVGVCLSV